MVYASPPAGRRAEARVGRDGAGAHLLEWLSRRFTYLGPEEWRAEAEAGRVLRNGRPAPPGAFLDAGDLLRYLPAPRPEPAVDVAYRIAYEDADWLVVDKPAPLPVHPGGAFFAHSLWRLLGESRGEAHFVTRLDRETTGLLLVARNADAARRARGAAAAGAIRKEYLAIVHGGFPHALEARGFLVPDPESRVRKKLRFVTAGLAAGGPAAATDFRGLATADHPGAGRLSLVAARLRTGRTHQIRATLRSLGFPVLGDKLYGLDEGCFLRFAAGEPAAADAGILILPHQALHSGRLVAELPGGPRLDIVAPPRWGDLGGLFAGAVADWAGR